MPFQGAARARLRASVAMLVLMLACAAGAGATASATAAGSAASALDPEERAFCTQINAYRAAKGLAPLRVSTALTRAAGWMSADMAANDYIDHTDSRGRTAPVRIRIFGFRSTVLGENLAAGMSTAATTFAQWKAEPAHRRGMLRSNFRLIGIGRAYSADSMMGWHWATTFGGGRERGVAC